MNTETQSIRASREALEHELKQAGAAFKGKACTCPFHEDKHASAGVYEDGGVWRFKCQVPTCGVSGDIFDIRARISNRSLADVLKEVSGDSQPKEKPKRVFASVAEIVASVGAWGNVEAKYEYTNPDTNAVEIVQIRYRDCEDGRKKFLVHRAAPGGFVLGAPPKPWPIYNRKRVRAANTVVVVEGEKCVHALHKIGIVATTSLSGAVNADKGDWSPLAGKKVYIWPDNDDAGRLYANDVAKILDTLNPRPEVEMLTADVGLGAGEDVADFIGLGGTADEVWCLLKDGSEPVGSHTELVTRLENIISGKWSAIDWPWRKLSEASKALYPGTQTVLCGDPAASKSFFILQSFQYWHKSGVQVALMELEDDKAHHLHRLLAILSGDWDVLDDKKCRENPDKTREVYSRHRLDIESFAPCLFSAPMGHVAYPQMLSFIEERCEAGAKIIGIDPITAVQTGETRQIEDLSFVVKASAILKKHEARLIVVTHPRVGAAKRGASSQDEIAGGRAFSRHTQNVLWLHVHHPAKQFYCVNSVGSSSMRCNRSLHICKARNGPGHGWKLGFSFDRNVQFVEHGVVMAEPQDTDVQQIPSF